jgi:hypothetical protein
MKLGEGSLSKKVGVILLQTISLIMLTLLAVSARAQTPLEEYNTGMNLYNSGRHESALSYIKQAAQSGLKQAQYQLCVMYKYGQGMKVSDHAEAYVWCKKSSEQGYPQADYELAMSLQAGKGVEKDSAMALRHLMKASKEGVREAQYALGFLYEFGQEGVTKNYYQARTLYMWSSGKGYSPATYRVGVMYEHGKGVRPNMKTALRWYKKAASMRNEEAKEKLSVLLPRETSEDESLEELDLQE